MQIDFRPRDTWSADNEQVAEKLNINTDKVAVKIYQGVAHAVVEAAVGVSKLYSLKKKIFYFKNMNPIFEVALLSLAKDGYQLVGLDLKVLEEPEAWAATLVREDLCVLYSLDEPLLGRAYDVSAFEKCLQDKSLIKIRLSHLRHRYENILLDDKSLVDKNLVAIYSLAPHLAVATLGDRARVGATVADQLRYETQIEYGPYIKLAKADQSAVVAFEASRIAGAEPLFSSRDLRVYDRAAIYWQNIDGQAVIDRLATKLDIQLKAPGLETRLETTSLSRWGKVKTFDFYKALGHSPETLRGLVLISHELIAKDRCRDFEKKLIEVHQSILEDQFSG